MYCEMTHFSALVCPDIVIPNLDVFRAIWSHAASDVVSRFFSLNLLFSRFFSVINGFSGSLVSRVHRYPEIRDPTLKKAGVKPISAWGFL